MRLSRTTILDPPEKPLPTSALLNLDEIDQFNIDQFIGNENGSAEESLKTLQFLARYGLISNEFECHDNCQQKMSLVKDSTQDKYIWRCNHCRGNNNSASARLSVRAHSYLYGSRLPLEKELKLIAHWACSPQDTSETVQRVYKITADTYAKRYESLRNFTDSWFQKNAAIDKIGGSGKIVEIDESLINKAKHNRGRQLIAKQIWILGGIERGSNKLFMEIIDGKRDFATMAPIIRKYVKPGTRIVTDGWLAYRKLQNEYPHEWVNHKLQFVDPLDKTVHTQSIEATWGALKRSLKHVAGVKHSKLNSYLTNYIFRRFYQKEKIFARICNVISTDFKPQ